MKSVGWDRSCFRMRGKQGNTGPPRLWTAQVPRSRGRNAASSWSAVGMGKDVLKYSELA